MTPATFEPRGPRLYRFLSRTRQRFASAFYAVATAVAYALAFLVRFELRPPDAHVGSFLLTPTAIAKVNLAERSHAEGIRELIPRIDRWRLEVGDPDLRSRLENTWEWCCGVLVAGSRSSADGGVLTAGDLGALAVVGRD